ncbi:conserved hypothetical protein [Talaromyces stipitatus ATCC 10500]|uniref:Uncharacterized protein n=1 Tax=Talaromyces stipitatus (strain ATCC 10500 / CBS 375.48 / QM 6759 / NRRL 1006) TaxID=441959 RepID=B8LX48_TALSN|nr:uncharacterized protein TSTA_061860 [Talaromyces stipitatus ATCC 10500]EED22698.1 conserved hypothetical protein [Talaromyces stipitatus ATCC 10500]
MTFLIRRRALKTKSKDKGLSVYGATCSPVNIVSPTQTLPPSDSATTLAGALDTPPSNTSRCKQLNVPGPQDAAVKNYSEWHASKVDDYDLKNDYRKAYQVIFNRPDPNFFIEREVKIGTAHRFVDVDDIMEWAERY